MRQPVPFGKYLLLDRISVGGMAEVFKAKSYGVEGFEKIIAIKRILPTMGEDRDFIKMFIDEAKIAGQLAHANICQIFELGRIDGSHFIAMEYIWGKDLLQIQNRLRKTKQTMPIPMACFVIAKVLEGLDYAHRKRDPLGRPLEIVHRDCSPQNVLVSYEGEVKVIDFGIAKATSRNSRTMAGVLKGKFGYMSPEQVRGLPLDRRSDIFAIGTMLYECLTGERLFQGETDFSTLEKVRNVDIAAPRQVNPAIPEAIEKIILKALAKDVEDRYQWCSEMLADLQAYLMSQDVVFTAKSLSSWLKEVFAQEIERERQLLEQYKRVGRDGLIAGVPSAQAKLDVVEHLGEAGQPEGDATMLGGPNFDDVEKDTGAAPDLAPSPAAGGPRGSVQRKGAAAPTPVAYQEDEAGEGDFGEEAPTEIFGETESPAQPAPPPAVGRAPSQRDIGAPPGKPPPKPPPGPRPLSNSPVPLAASAPTRSVGNPAAAAASDGLAATASVGFAPGSYPPPIASPQPAATAPSGPQLATGTPGAIPQQNGLAVAEAQPQPQRTVLGVQAPVGLGNYSGGYRPSQQLPGQPVPGQPPAPGQQPLSVQPPASPAGSPPMAPYPGYPAQSGYPAGYPPGYAQPGYPGYPSGAMPSGAAPLESTAPIAEGKRSTLVRDIGIGVAIAAFVLVGFFVVKVFVLDSDSKPSGSGPAATSKFATVKLAMPAGIAAEMFVDGERIATVTSDSPGIPVTAGVRHIKLVGTNGLSCDDPKVKLEAGKTTTLECNFGMTGSVGSAGSSAATGSGSAATIAQGSEAGSGDPEPMDSPGDASKSVEAKAGDARKPAEVRAADAKAADAKAADAKATDVKAADARKPAEVKAIDAKATDASKPAEVKVTDAKATSAKADKTADAKVASAKLTDTKSADAKASDAKKPGDTKKLGDGKKPGAPSKPDDKKPSDGKPPADAKAAAADPNKGYLQVFSKPPAKILVDGNDTNLKTPISGQTLALTPGKHKITFVIGDDRFTYSVIIKAGVTETMSKDLE